MPGEQKGWEEKLCLLVSQAPESICNSAFFPETGLRRIFSIQLTLYLSEQLCSSAFIQQHGEHCSLAWELGLRREAHCEKMSVPFQENSVSVLMLPALTRRCSAGPVSFLLIYQVVFLYVEFERKQTSGLRHIQINGMHSESHPALNMKDVQAKKIYKRACPKTRFFIRI